MAAVLEYLTVGAVSSQQLPELEARLEALCDRDESGSVASDVSYEEYVYTAPDASRSGGAAEVRLQHHFNGTWLLLRQGRLSNFRDVSSRGLSVAAIENDAAAIVKDMGFKLSFVRRMTGKAYSRNGAVLVTVLKIEKQLGEMWQAVGSGRLVTLSASGTAQQGEACRDDVVRLGGQLIPLVDMKAIDTNITI